jgi:2-octaprenyl-6-methoxyphenol hydroxylase
MPTPDTARAFDVAIIGPGPVGATAALAFAARGLEVALVGPASPRRDGRTVALMDVSWRLLEQFGVADTLQAVSAPLSTMRLVDDTGSLFRRPPTEFRAGEIGLEQFGWNVETVRLNEALLDAVAAHPAITRLTDSVTSMAANAGGHADVALANGATLQARLVGGADGRQSVVRRDAGIVARTWTYPQAALTTIVKHTRRHRDVSTEFHTRFGPCTTVPLPGRRSSVVWMASPDEAQRLMALGDAELAAAIETRTHSILGQLTIDGPRGLTPMGGLSVERFTGPRTALLGEAAHVFPPIGAQGLNLGFRDVVGLVACASGSDPGAAEGLERYERNRAGDVRTRTSAVDALNRSLLSDLVPIDLARGLGLLALDTLAPLRRFMMRQGLSPTRA